MSTELRVAFIGLGTMGAPMAVNVARAGISVTVHNRTPGRTRTALEAGARSAPSPGAAADGADVVITMLTGGDAVEKVLFGEAGAARTASAGKLFVDMSTSGPRAARRIADRLADLGARFVDAPVSGTRGPAETGELVVLAGGDEDDVRRLKPIFSAVGKRTVHAGPVGAGQALKVVLNGVGCYHLVAFAAMLRLGERAGLSREVLVDAFTGGAFATPAYRGKRERVLARRYGDPDFVLDLALRDAELCAELQEEVGFVLDSHRAARAEVARAVDAGLGEFDLFALERGYSDERS